MKMPKPEKLLQFIIILILLIVIFSGFLYHLFGYNIMGILDKTPLCIFRLITGKKCPGCGMTHAFISIGQLNISEAFRFNIFAIPLFLYIIIFLIRPKSREIFNNKFFVYLILIIALVYWVVRNL